MKYNNKQIEDLYRNLKQQEILRSLLMYPKERLTDTERVEAIAGKNYSKNILDFLRRNRQKFDVDTSDLYLLPDADTFKKSLNDKRVIYTDTLSNMLKNYVQREALNKKLDSLAPQFGNHPGWLLDKEAQDKLPEALGDRKIDSLHYDDTEGSFHEHMRELPFLQDDVQLNKNVIDGVKEKF
jgi:hypothetical protein